MSVARFKTNSKSFMALEDAPEINKVALMGVVIAISLCEGGDNSLYGRVSQDLVGWYPFFTLPLLGTLSTVQGIVGAVSGPFWGIAASRGTLTRKQILLGGSFVQGVATIMLAFVVDLPFPNGLMIAIIVVFRVINAIALAALRPIATSIVADAFNDEERGKMFGMVMSGVNIGSGVFGMLAGSIGSLPLGGPPFRGWQIAFQVVGVFTVLVTVAISSLLHPPKLVIDEERLKLGAKGEIMMLGNLMKTPTFAVLVVQGCFGLIPWRAFEYRTLFLRVRGLEPSVAALIDTIGQFTGAVGATMGGAIGDFLATKFHPAHGRILCAEISVYGGIPIAYLMFYVSPPGAPFLLDDEKPFSFVFYYAALIILLSLWATWAGPGCNAPVLCTICKPGDRALVMAWQASLEQGVGSLGPLMFTLVMRALNFNEDCFNQDFLGIWEDCERFREDCEANNNPADWVREVPIEVDGNESSAWVSCENTSEVCVNCWAQSQIDAAGLALLVTSSVPWTVCGLFYTSLHYFYPRDLARVLAERGELLEPNELGGPLVHESDP